MGYRSTVYIAVDIKHKPALLGLLAQHSSLYDMDEFCQGKSTFHCAYHGIKWYNTYPEVVAITNFIKSLGHEAMLLRIGEDETDIERIGDYDAFGYDYYVHVDVPSTTSVELADILAEFPELQI